MTIEAGPPAIYSPPPFSSSHAVSPSKIAPTLHPRQFTREFDLLLLCASSNQHSGTDNIRDFSNDLEWQAFLRITEHHRLLPQVYGALRERADIVPKEVLEKLHRGYQANVRQTLRLTRDLVRVLKHFESCGVRAIAYKGPALALILSGNVSGRQFADLDLMIHSSDVQNAKAALAQLGYVAQSSLTDRQEESYIHSGYENAFDLADAQNILELKWRVLPRFYSIDFDVAAFFDRATTIEIGGYPALTLCPEDLLLVLCVHAAKHAWSELSLLWDVSQLVQRKPIDWESAYKHANELGILRILNINLALATVLLGDPLPSSFPGRLESENGIDFLTPTFLSLVAKSEQVNTETVAYFRFMLSLREGWRHRVRFLWRLMATPGPGEWSLLSLPSWLFPVYYVVRALRLAARIIMKIPPTSTPLAETKTTSAAV